MTREEFDRRVRAQGGQVDSDIHRQVRDLMVEGGTLLQIAGVIYTAKQDLLESLASGFMLSDEAIRVAIGRQGQINGIDIALGAIYDLMQVKGTGDEQA